MMFGTAKWGCVPKIYVRNRNHQMRGVLEIYGELESPKEKACLRSIISIISRKHQMR